MKKKTRENIVIIITKGGIPFGIMTTWHNHTLILNRTVLLTSLCQAGHYAKRGSLNKRMTHSINPHCKRKTPSWVLGHICRLAGLYYSKFCIPMDRTSSLFRTGKDRHRLLFIRSFWSFSTTYYIHGVRQTRWDSNYSLLLRKGTVLGESYR